MGEIEEIIEEDREAFERIADSDLPANWIARELLEQIEGNTSYSSKESSESDITPTEKQEQPKIEAEEKNSLFAY